MTAKRTQATAHLRTSSHIHAVKPPTAPPVSEVKPSTPPSISEDFAVIVMPSVVRAVTMLAIHVDTLKTVVTNTVKTTSSSASSVKAALKEFVRKTVAEQP